MKYRMKLGKDTGTRYLVISSNGVVLVIFVGISSIFEDEGVIWRREVFMYIIKKYNIASSFIFDNIVKLKSGIWGPSPAER